MTKQFVPIDWLLQHPNPLACRFVSFKAEIPDEITLESLHRRLGKRRTASRDGLDLLSHLEQLSNALS